MDIYFKYMAKIMMESKITEGTNTCHWYPNLQVPKYKEVVYIRPVIDVRLK